MEYVIRIIKKNELSRLIEMCQSHAEYEKAAYVATGKEEQLRQALFTTNQKLFCYVVESNQQLIGYFSYTFDYSTWDAQTFLYLDCIYLEPEYRGLKIGDSIIEKLKNIARKNNCVSIQWQTPVANEKAIKFYNRIGARGKGKVRFFLTL